MAAATTKTTPKADEKSTAQEAVITDFLSSVIDSTRELVDGLLESAGDVEKNVRERADKAVDRITSGDDVEVLRKQIQSLSDQVEKLAKLRVSTTEK